MGRVYRRRVVNFNIYKDNLPDKGIILEDKTNEEKNMSHEFKAIEIFKASDLMVDSLTQLISKKRKKQK